MAKNKRRKLYTLCHNNKNNKRERERDRETAYSTIYESNLDKWAERLGTAAIAAVVATAFEASDNSKKKNKNNPTTMMSAHTHKKITNAQRKCNAIRFSW